MLKICEKINETFNCKKNLEFSDGELSSVSDMWCDVKTENVRFDEEGIIINGVVTAFIIALDNDGAPSFYEKAVDFKYTHPINSENQNFKCSPDISVLTSNYTLTGPGSMELRVDLNISAAVYECNNIPLIVDIKLKDEPIKKGNRGAMTAYFASAGENIWDIARRYCADLQELKQINDISENELSEDLMILVPNN